MSTPGNEQKGGSSSLFHQQSENLVNGQKNDYRNLQPDDAGTDNAVVTNLMTLAPMHLKVGDTIVLTNTTGSINRVVTIVGFYQTNATGLNGTLSPIWGTKETVII